MSLSAFVILLFTSSALVSGDKRLEVVQEFDSAKITQHYRFSLFGVEIISLNSRPVVSLVKEQQIDAGDSNGTDFLNLLTDWDKLWNELGVPTVEVLRQNPHIAYAVAVIGLVYKGFRDFCHKSAAPHADAIPFAEKIEELSAKVDRVNQTQDLIAKGFATVIRILRGGRNNGSSEGEASDAEPTEPE